MYHGPNFQYQKKQVTHISINQQKLQVAKNLQQGKKQSHTLHIFKYALKEFATVVVHQCRKVPRDWRSHPDLPSALWTTRTGDPSSRAGEAPERFVFFGKLKKIARHKKKLVGGFNPCEKYARQIGSFPQVGVKIKNIWNHHLEKVYVYIYNWIYWLIFLLHVSWSFK